jgi:hypothetical protein
MERGERSRHIDFDEVCGAQSLDRRRKASPVLPIGDGIGAVAETSRERALRALAAQGAKDFRATALE